MFIKTSSKNQIINNINQSAGNPIGGSSETIRKLSEKDIDWLAGVLDGDGNFDIINIKNCTTPNGSIITTRRALKQIRITQHPRDGRILYRVKEILGGSIKPKGKKYLIWTISTKSQMIYCLNLINGKIRLKVPGFKEACLLTNITYIQANYKIERNSGYLSGLTDTDGSIVLNYPSNRIELNLEFNDNEYSSAIDFSEVIPGAKLCTLKLIKRNQTQEKIFYSIRFSYNTVENMRPLYEYFLLNRLYSDFKFYRAMQIKRFLELRAYHNHPKDSPEFLLYYNFIKNFVTHLNEHKAPPVYLKTNMETIKPIK